MVDRLRAAGCVFAEDEARILLSAAATADDLEAMLARRVSGLPLEQVVGWTEFFGLRIAVAPEVFVPRRRTEFLVRQAADVARPGAVVVDLCCGSGAVGVALVWSLGRAELHAVDVDAAAVGCARGNVASTGRVYHGDLFAPLPLVLLGGVDVLVANAPYVPTDSLGLLPAEARLHEPRLALDGGVDGLDVQQRIVAGALPWLTPGGHVLFETSADQAERTADLFTRTGLSTRIARSEELDATVVIGSAPLREAARRSRRLPR